MIARAGSGWQTVLADLAIILFMVTAATLSQQDDQPSPAKPAGQPAATPAPSPRGMPLALYRPGPGAPPVRDWLAAQGADARQQLTIVAQYGAGGLWPALAQAGRLAGEAGAAGMRARIVVEPGAGGVSAALGFDEPGLVLARSLQTSAEAIRRRSP